MIILLSNTKKEPGILRATVRRNIQRAMMLIHASAGDECTICMYFENIQAERIK